MAEIAELSKEQRIGELEELKRIKLMDDFEINKIKKQREFFEYKLVAPQKKLKDILNYIAYEETILVLLHERRKSRNIFAKKNIEFRIITKVCNLFQKAIARFPNNIDVWDKYIKFCKASDNKSKVTALWSKYISFHGDKYLTWYKAGMWEWIENKNYIKSISYLTRGLQRHPKSFELFMALFKVELDSVKEFRIKTKEEDSNPESVEVSSLQKAAMYYEKLKEENLTLKDNLSHLLKLVREYDFANSLYTNISNDVQLVKDGLENEI